MCETEVVERMPKPQRASFEDSGDTLMDLFAYGVTSGELLIFLSLIFTACKMGMRMCHSIIHSV